jgi:hypothetical protein
MDRTKQEIEALVHLAKNAEFWRSFAPKLSISDAPKHVTPLMHDAQTAEDRRSRYREEGYLCFDGLEWKNPLREMAGTMRKLRGYGFPPAFIGLFDQPWIMAAQMQPLISDILGAEAQFVPDFWGSVVLPGEGGFNIHRDRPRGALDASGNPLSATVWMPLTPALSDNGGMYVIPANEDVNYYEVRSLISVDPQQVRALPAHPGEILVWSGRTAHWGGRASRFAKRPRINIAWEFQSAAVAPLDGYVLTAFPDIPFEARLSLIAKRMGHYQIWSEWSEIWDRLYRSLTKEFPIKDHFPESLKRSNHTPS